MNDHKTYDVAGATAYLLSGGLGETQGLISLAMSTGAQQVSIDADHLQALADLAAAAVAANAAPAARAPIAVKALEWFEAGGSHYGQCGDVVAYIIEPSGVGAEGPWILLSPYGAIGHYASPDAAKPAAQDNLAAVIAGFIVAPVAAGWQADALVAAAREVTAGKFATYKARNGRMCSVEADDGERVWLVHSHLIDALEHSLPAAPGEG